MLQEVKEIDAVVKEQPQEKKQRKPRESKKKPRNVDESKFTYLKAFAQYKKETGYVGLSPKKNTPEYLTIMEILRKGQAKK